MTSSSKAEKEEPVFYQGFQLTEFRWIDSDGEIMCECGSSTCDICNPGWEYEADESDPDNYGDDF